MRLLFTSLLFALLLCQSIRAQPPKPVDKESFFADQSILNATLVMPMSKIIHHGGTGKNTITARFICKLPDSSEVNEQILVDTRGHFRRDFCFMPPLKLIFNKKDSSALSSLKSLKLVSACKSSSMYSQYLLKEFLVYKIYNLLTDKSFRVRLLNLTYSDSSGKKKPLKDYAFLVEDIKQMAKRNGCKELSEGKPATEATDRKQMTMVAIFEYMIGNTDWAVSVKHNIRLIQSKQDPPGRPFAVAYDFDYSGLVNTDYAVPDPLLGTETVLERVYRGFPRTMDELNEALAIFNKQKDAIYSLINNFDPLSKYDKQKMIDYLNDFFEMIKKPSNVESAFIDGARRN